MPTSIVLATLNARYAHTSLALRYLRANLGVLRKKCVLHEFVLGVAPEVVVEQLLAEQPRIIGLSVYIWNVAPLTQVVALLKATAPDVVVVVGGPEVSHEVESQRICALADYVVTGWGEVTFARLAHAVLEGQGPLRKVHAGEQAPLEAIVFPYDEFSDHDLRHRRLYVEASRGCPFTCEFCLSALDRTAWAFPLAPLLAELGRLYDRGARAFRFVDRTFNLKTDTALAILGFFLERIRERPGDLPFLHFELVPDHLPERLKGMIAEFPAGTLQLEIGVQTFNPAVQSLISRRQDNARSEANLRWLRTRTNAHLHADLIVGLPGEDLPSFAAGFDRLARLGPHEIQVGILKRLRGAPVGRHTAPFGMRFSADPPYAVQATDRIDADSIQRLVRFARYWDLVGNSGRFSRTLPILLGDAPFERFFDWSDWLYGRLGKVHGIPAESLYEYLLGWLLLQGAPTSTAAEALVSDYEASGARGRLAFAAARTILPPSRKTGGTLPTRQARHLKPRTHSSC
jgi:radical SAM superfamily enzyme YgiQ (UPF0313 family)